MVLKKCCYTLKCVPIFTIYCPLQLLIDKESVKWCQSHVKMSVAILRSLTWHLYCLCVHVRRTLEKHLHVCLNIQVEGICNIIFYTIFSQVSQFQRGGCNVFSECWAYVAWEAKPRTCEVYKFLTAALKLVANDSSLLSFGFWRLTGRGHCLEKFLWENQTETVKMWGVKLGFKKLRRSCHVMTLTTEVRIHLRAFSSSSHQLSSTFAL